MICSFFGHKDTPASVKTELKSEVTRVIERYPNTTFYVGHNGSFDSVVLSVLKELAIKFPNISYAVILAYLPKDNSNDYFKDVSTIYPEGIEAVPKKYAISYRNDWMVKQSDMVICYITHSFGGAAKFVDKARRADKTVCNLADLKQQKISAK